VRPAVDGISIESQRHTSHISFFGRTLSIAPHRLVDLACPRFDAAVEVDGVVKAGVSEKVDDHLTASAMMANDYQWLIRWQDIGARWDLRHRNM
jgi:hypothetical protein